jgi:NAD(P)H dehydrogenase (quinone)
MKMLIVYCHPLEASFCAALRDRVILALTAASHTIKVLDLYATGFDPVLSAQERLDYHTPEVNERLVGEHLELLRWCEGLVFVYPTWWYGPPAMLKGWLDRVWIPHAAFEMPQPMQPIGRILTNIRFIAAVSTLGSPWWWWKIAMAEPGRKILLKGLGALCHPRCKTMWLALYQMDSTGAVKRKRFLDKVEDVFRRLR